MAYKNRKEWKFTETLEVATKDKTAVEEMSVPIKMWVETKEEFGKIRLTICAEPAIQGQVAVPYVDEVVYKIQERMQRIFSQRQITVSEVEPKDVPYQGAEFRRSMTVDSLETDQLTKVFDQAVKGWFKTATSEIVGDMASEREKKMQDTIEMLGKMLPNLKTKHIKYIFERGVAFGQQEKAQGI